LLDNAFSKVEEINLIKMDIEGSEVAALRGMSKLVKRFKYPPIYIEINAYTLFLLSETPYSLLKTVDDLGYKTYIMNDDNTLSTYPIDTFSTDVLMENVLLFKELPANLTVVPKIYPNSSEMIDWIVEKCSNIENFKHPMEYILYALKDFPQYYNEPRINKLLSKIATSENNDDVSPHINKAIDWFRIMQKDK
ncbi:MAG: FkbM family methyltransferase, partial [Firmicutes bacterium]|nr:FkbM family methyltransferase [Bacillota bacterium]